ncbi:3-phosphoserine/phosphohydroxythreonine transaminase [Methyloversatilis thermotolerans]|uniref:3-phosphoserine/phosphohydroxythreonine transaminase n=1 Tax=Methyloversatilis thermotolerans TaxID=1346290 RepID=UPI00036F10EF|nr:3-phosphoserine/phosphohydroxythreonine transaminase [Methyloversatilis thermotolerans]
MGDRAYNFGAGPAMMPDEVIERIAREWQDFHGEGYSAMELGHRSERFADILARAKADLRSLLGVPESHHVLFLHGGATPHFAMVPLNLAGPGAVADYIHTGYWSDKAMAEASAHINVRIAASAADSEFDRVPDRAGWKLDPQAAYVHICANETIGGVEFADYPDTGAVPLVADMSSNILSQPLDVSRFGLIYAGAQKNIGPAGLAVVIIRDDLLGRVRDGVPSVMKYARHVEWDSMYNTPAAFSIWVTGLVFEYVKKQGGVAEMARRSEEKSRLVYDVLDRSSLYINRIQPASRSRMNIPFFLREPRLNTRFLDGARRRGLLNLKGHRATGGIRASLYNAMPLDGARALADYMTEFERKHG